MPLVRHHVVQVPATSANLGPGFDAFGLAVARHLWVRTVAREPGADRVLVRGDDHAELATGDDNLVWRSFVTFCEDHEVAVPDVGLVTASDIPLERGLGSSSSAIVAGLVLARAVTGVACGDRDLVAVATRIEGHPDNVAPALLGGLVACVVDDRGDLIVRRITPGPAQRPLLFVPSQRQATVTARAVLPDVLAVPDVVAQASRAGHVLAGLSGLWPVDPGAVGDRLHEPPRLAVMAGSASVVAALRERGVVAWLSGAGPSVAAVVDGPSASDLDGWRSLAEPHGFDVLAPRFDLSGALVCPEDGCALAGSPPCVQCPGRRV